MTRTTGKQQGAVLPIVAVVTLLAMGSITHVAYAVSNGTTLTSPNPALFGHFGFSVAINENDPIVVVGAPQENADSATEAAGHAYVYDATTGDPIQTLTSPNMQLNGNFGSSVAISGTTVVVGAPQESVGTIPARVGQAYVLDATTGDPIQTLTSPNMQEGSIFGFSVAISGTTVVVGAPFESLDTTMGHEGRAYVFDAASGDLIHTLTSPNPQFSGNFGLSVSISDTTVVVGAPGESLDTTMGHEGNAYVFDAASGNVIHTLDSRPAQPDGAFGRSVAISGATVVVGAPRESADTTIQGAGNAYLFDASTGEWINTLTSTNPQEIGAFGTSVAVSRGTVVVGAPGESVDTTMRAAGNAYVFDASTGEWISTLTSTNPILGGGFGWSVGVVEDAVTIVVGAPFEKVGMTTVTAGHAYVF